MGPTRSQGRACAGGRAGVVVAGGEMGRRSAISRVFPDFPGALKCRMQSAECRVTECEVRKYGRVGDDVAGFAGEISKWRVPKRSTAEQSRTKCGNVGWHKAGEGFDASGLDGEGKNEFHGGFQSLFEQKCSQNVSE